MKVAEGSKLGRFAVGVVVLCLPWSSSSVTGQTTRSPQGPNETILRVATDQKRQAVLSFRNRDYESALEHFQAAVAADPTDVESQDNVGVTLARLGRTREATAALLRAIAIDRRFPPPHYHLGLIYDQMGRTAEAIARYQEALQLNPGFAEARYALSGVCWRIGDLEGAVKLLTESLRSDPNSLEIRLNLAMGLWRKGDLDAAIRELEKVKMQHSTAPSAFPRWVRF